MNVQSEKMTSISLEYSYTSYIKQNLVKYYALI